MFDQRCVLFFVQALQRFLVAFRTSLGETDSGTLRALVHFSVLLLATSLLGCCRRSGTGIAGCWLDGWFVGSALTFRSVRAACACRSGRSIAPPDRWQVCQTHHQSSEGTSPRTFVFMFHALFVRVVPSLALCTSQARVRCLLALVNCWDACVAAYCV